MTANTSSDSTGHHQDRSRERTVIRTFIAGSASSALTAIIYQPLELVKTRLQIRDDPRFTHHGRIFGRATQSMKLLIKDNGLSYLWRGTYASLARSIPGVGLYYSTLHILQTNYSSLVDRPDNAQQALCFGMISRSLVSFTLLPVTVVKVRYESGRYNYPTVLKALTDAYLRNGWVGMAPTIMRDSIFSGIYYMSYTHLKSNNIIQNNGDSKILKHLEIFIFGLISGTLASLLTNPLDVLKTNIQISKERGGNLFKTAAKISKDSGPMRFLDGLALRSLRRALVAATTWTFYESFMQK